MVLLEVASIASVYTLTYFCLLGLTPNPVLFVGGSARAPPQSSCSEDPDVKGTET